MKILGLATLLISTSVWANHNAEIFSKGTDPKDLMFTTESVSTVKDGITDSTTTYKNTKGDVVIQETSKVKGSELITYSIDQKQTGQKGVIEIVGDKVKFTRTDKDGSVKNAEEKKVDNLTVSGNFVAYVEAHWKELMEGKEISVRHAVWDRVETVGFNLKKMGEDKIGDVKVIKIRMKASSFIIAALVSPLTFSFSEDGAKLLAMDGRVAPKKDVDGKLKDLDGHIVYHYK